MHYRFVFCLWVGVLQTVLASLANGANVWISFGPGRAQTTLQFQSACALQILLHPTATVSCRFVREAQLTTVLQNLLKPTLSTPTYYVLKSHDTFTEVQKAVHQAGAGNITSLWVVNISENLNWAEEAEKLRQADTVLDIAYVQTTARVGSVGYQLVWDYQPLFQLTSFQMQQLLEYMRYWSILRQCCGMQLSADWRHYLWNDTDWKNRWSVTSPKYPGCESRNITEVQRRIMQAHLWKPMLAAADDGVAITQMVVNKSSGQWMNCEKSYNMMRAHQLGFNEQFPQSVFEPLTEWSLRPPLEAHRSQFLLPMQTERFSSMARNGLPRYFVQIGASRDLQSALQYHSACLTQLVVNFGKNVRCFTTTLEQLLKFLEQEPDDNHYFAIRLDDASLADAASLQRWEVGLWLQFDNEDVANTSIDTNVHNVMHVQTGARLKMLGHHILEDFAQLFGLSRENVDSFVSYFRWWMVLFQCCGMDMSEVWFRDMQQGATGNKFEATYPACDTYVLTEVEKLFLKHPWWRSAIDAFDPFDALQHMFVDKSVESLLNCQRSNAWMLANGGPGVSLPKNLYEPLLQWVPDFQAFSKPTSDMSGHALEVPGHAWAGLQLSLSVIFAALGGFGCGAFLFRRQVSHDAKLPVAYGRASIEAQSDVEVAMA